MFYMKLLTNWYGLRDARLNWFDCIKSGHIDRSFTQSAINLCLFTHSQILIVVYIDNVLVAAKTTRQIDSLLDSLRYSMHIDTGK